MKQSMIQDSKSLTLRHSDIGCALSSYVELGSGRLRIIKFILSLYYRFLIRDYSTELSSSFFKCQSREDLLFQELILELLFTQNLPRLLASSDQVRQHLIGGAIRQVFVNHVVICSDFAGYLVRKTFQLSKSDSMVSLDVSRHYFFLGYFYTVVVVRGNQQK